MKNRFLMRASVVLVTLCVGCGVIESNWYPVEGGYINLRQVTRITTRFSMSLRAVENDEVKKEEIIAEEDLITSETITKAKNRIRELMSGNRAENISKESPRLEFNRVSYQAAIIFDYAGGGSCTVNLRELENWSSSADLLGLLDGWQASVDELKGRLGQVLAIGR